MFACTLLNIVTLEVKLPLRHGAATPRRGLRMTFRANPADNLEPELNIRALSSEDHVTVIWQWPLTSHDPLSYCNF